MPAFPFLLTSYKSTEDFPEDSAYSCASLETMRCQAGRIPLWPLHRARLLRSGNIAGKQLEPVERALLQLRHACAHAGAVKVRLRIGWLNGELNWDLSAVPLDITPGAGLSGDGLESPSASLFLCKTRLPLSETENIGCKDLLRTRYNQAAAELPSGSAANDGLLADTRGYVIETLRCNLLLWRDGRWVTPDLSHSGVHGVMREWLSHEVELEFTDLTLEELMAVESDSPRELAICNSVRGVIPVREIMMSTGVSNSVASGKNDRSAGPQARRLQQLIAEKLW